MGPLLRGAAGGVLGVAGGVALVAAYKLWADIDRSIPGARPVPILVGEYVTRP